MKMSIDMLYSIYRDGIFKFLQNIPLPKDNVTIIIVHQILPDDKYDYLLEPLLLNRKDIQYTKSHTKGVTKSRNIAISKAKSDIVLFCDDDVKYISNLNDIITTAYTNNPQYSFLTFSYLKNNEWHKFKKQIIEHDYRTILNIGTIEVSCLRKHILDNHFQFPEDLGAGQKYFLCDEPVFLSQFLKKKYKGKYIPVIIGEHPDESSGSIFNNIYAFKSRVLCFQRVFGKLTGTFLYYLFLIKNLKKFDSFKSVIHAFILVHSK
ncbi:glycosyltransferase family 2 protein [Proteus mirabilis]|nr:glycosyltransferase family 2 protein [Proteus mirabilis]MBI6433758.1 glycosyltransferase family 2 protein [Proteus mirabilis]